MRRLHREEEIGRKAEALNDRIVAHVQSEIDAIDASIIGAARVSLSAQFAVKACFEFLEREGLVLVPRELVERATQSAGST